MCGQFDISKYQTIVWDWNGTLLDDLWLAVEIDNVLLQRRGLPLVDAEFYAANFCMPVIDYYKILNFDMAAESYETIALEFIEEYEKRCQECQLQNHALDLLAHFSKMGLKQAILSACHADSLAVLVRHFGIEHYFTQLIGMDNHYAHSKIEAGEQWITEQDIDPSRVLLIGDTVHDYEASQAMGTDCVLIARGHQCLSRLESCGVPVFESLEKLKSCLEIQPAIQI